MLCLWLSACTDPFAKEEFVAYEEQPIGLYLESQPRFSDWVKLLKTADLYNAVNMSNNKYTCFVADNDAVQAYVAASGQWQSLDDITEEEAKSIMEYHIIPLDYAYTGLPSGKLSTQTISGDYLTVALRIEDGVERRYIDSVEVFRPADETSLINGYVHELKSVLNPIIYTIMDMLEQKQEYSIFTAAVKACGFDSYLGRRDITVNNIEVRDYKAVIVVSDSVFRANGINSLEDLKKKFPGDPTDPLSEFYRYVGYHIYSGAYDFGELTDFAIGSTGKSIESYIAREFMSVTDEKGSIVLNPNGDEKNLCFLPGKYDTHASNGFIHEVSGLMPISDPVCYAFEWEPTEWDEFRVMEDYRKQRAKGTADVWAPPTFLKEGEAPHFRWKTIPYKEDVVGYGREDVDWDRFKNDDCLYAELGDVGWLEFDTPTIMRGKYNIQIVKYSWFETGGVFQMYIDDSKFGATLNMGAQPGTQDMGDFTFTESGTHVFRFNVVDGGNKAIHGKFHLDRFIFTPVKD